MKLIYKLLLSMVALIGLELAVSCSTDTPDMPTVNNQNPYDYNNPIGSDNAGSSHIEDDNLKAQMQALIKECVKVESAYSNYTWHFKIESTLHLNVSETVKFGIGHGEINGVTNISVENDAYSYSSYMINGKKIMEFSNPIFFYWAFGLGSSDADSSTIFSEGLGNLYVLAALERKIADSGLLYGEEKLLYKETKDWLDQMEYVTNKNYHPSVWAYIGNKFYKVADYSR